jgi:hypothetical protein
MSAPVLHKRIKESYRRAHDQLRKCDFPEECADMVNEHFTFGAQILAVTQNHASQALPAAMIPQGPAAIGR